MASGVSNPSATPNADGTWHIHGHLHFPDGSEGDYDRTLTTEQYQYYLALVGWAIVPALLVSPSGPVSDKDVARVYCDFAIGQVWEGPSGAPPTPGTPDAAPDVTNPT